MASCRILEKSGFNCEGVLCKNAVKNGEVIDMRILRGEFFWIETGIYMELDGNRLINIVLQQGTFKIFIADTSQL